MLAIVHSADPRIVVFRARDGAIDHELRLLDGTAVLPGFMAWSASGMVAIAGVVGLLGDEAFIELGAEERTPKRQKIAPLRAYVWPNQGRPSSVPIDDLETGSNALTLDPGGRYLFLSGTGVHSALSLEGYDLRNGMERFTLFHTVTDIGQASTRTETVASTWLPGRYPLWETIEAHIPEEGEPTYTAWRLYTRPDLEGPRLERIELTEAPPARCVSRRVLPDGRTVGPADSNDAYDSCGRNALDPSGSLRGLAKDEIQRVDDGLRLQVGARGCLTTDTGFYSCLDLASEHRYVVGNDPVHALGIRGDQVASLFLRPQLLTEYLQGQPLAAPAKNQLLGLPPQLRIDRVVPGPSSTTPTEVSFSVFDGGSGLGQFRMYLDGEPFGRPLQLHEGRQSLTLPLLNGSCRELRAYACNAAGLLCSPVAMIPPCKATPKPDDRE